MTKYVDTFYRVATRAYMYDKAGNLYTGEQLMLALLLHAKGGQRTLDAEREVGALLDDPNQQKVKTNDRKRTGRPSRRKAPKSS